MERIYMKDKGNNSGLTLLELLMTAVILSILVGVCIPNLGNWLERNRQRDAAYELATIIRYARAKALELGNRVGIKLSLGGESDLDNDGEDEDYILFVDSNSNGDYNTGEEVIDDNKWGRGADIDASSDVIIYKTSGLILSGATTITIGNYEITVTPIIGRVTVK